MLIIPSFRKSLIVEQFQANCLNISGSGDKTGLKRGLYTEGQESVGRNWALAILLIFWKSYILSNS